MKLIHCADLHLGSKMDSRLPKDKADVRRGEVRTAFERMVAYAKENDIRHILMAGDIFDSSRPLKKDKEFFYNVVRGNPDITFYYLRGNHDTDTSYEEELENLVSFFDIWRTIRFDGIAVSGIELTRDNLASAASTLSLDSADVNIVMLHGEVCANKRDGSIHLAAYRNKSIDYLALGHIHSYAAESLDKRGTYVYSGCLEGRGYDELGPKGFVVLDITAGTVTHTFHPHAARTIWEYTVDIGDAADTYSAAEIVRRAVTARREDLVRITLTGEVGFDATDIDEDIRHSLEHDFFDVSVKDKTLRSLDLSYAEEDLSLRAEFIRTVMAYDDYSDEEKARIISIGSRALAGREDLV